MTAEAIAPRRPSPSHGSRCHKRRATGSSEAVRATAAPRRKPPRRARSSSCSSSRSCRSRSGGTSPWNRPSASTTTTTLRPPRAAVACAAASKSPSGGTSTASSASSPTGVSSAASRRAQPTTAVEETMAGEHTIEIDDLVVARGRALALADVSLTVRRGVVTGLLGPSGSGKTTLMRSIVGVQRIQSGTVRVLGEAGGAPALRRRVSYTTQAPSVYADLTIRENLRYFARVLDAPSTSNEVFVSCCSVQFAELRHAVADVGWRAKTRFAGVFLAAACAESHQEKHTAHQSGRPLEPERDRPQHAARARLSVGVALRKLEGTTRGAWWHHRRSITQPCAGAGFALRRGQHVVSSGDATARAESLQLYRRRAPSPGPDPATLSQGWGVPSRARVCAREKQSGFRKPPPLPESGPNRRGRAEGVGYAAGRAVS